MGLKTRLVSYAVPLALLILALFIPLPLYLVSLALFGLPHIVWELGFIRQRYAGRWPVGWWLALWIVLLGNATIRAGTWLGLCSAETSQAIDIITLLLLALIVACAPRHMGWRVRIVGMSIACVMWWLLQQSEVLTALLIMSLAHNFTPVLLAWDLAADLPERRPLAWRISLLFALPWLIVLVAWAHPYSPGAWHAYVPLLDHQLPATWIARRQALWSAIALAQCLHYYCVIHLLPASQRQAGQPPLLPRAIQLTTLLTVALLLVYYVVDYAAARKLYSVAAGVHAWLEWPVLLVALLSNTTRRSQPLAANTRNMRSVSS